MPTDETPAPTDTPRTRTYRAITLKEQKTAYNELAARAQELGLSVKIHKSKTFNNYEEGEKRIAAVQAMIAAVPAAAQ